MPTTTMTARTSTQVGYMIDGVGGVWYGSSLSTNNKWTFNTVHIINTITLAPMGSIWQVNAMVNIYGVSSGTISQARLALLNTSSSIGSQVSYFNDSMFQYYAGPNGWLIDGATKGDIITPSTNHNILTVSGMVVCNNGSGNNGTVSLALYLHGTAGGTATTSNGYFYATRIA